MSSAKRFGAYHRISRLNGRDLDAESTITDKEAWDKIDGWARMTGHRIADHYLDVDVSGSKMNRPELGRLLADLRAGRLDGIVVAQVDRLSRADVGDALAVVREILEITSPDKDHPSGLVLLDLGIDPSTEFGEFGLTILLGLARMQWRRYKRQWTSAQARAVKRGVWIGAVPLGYDRGVDGVLEPNGDAPAVIEAFKIAGLDGLHAACRFLAERFPVQRWETSDARRIFASEAYLGRISYGELVNRAAHDPLVSPAVWQAAQTEPRNRRPNGDYPLTGIPECGRCGEPLVGALQTVNGRKYRRMRCSSEACRGGSSISADKLEAYVRRALEQPLADPTIRTRAVGADVSAAQAALERAETARDAFAGDIEYQEALGREQALTTARMHAERVEAARGSFQTAAATVARTTDLPAASELGDPDQLVRAVGAMIDRIVVKPGRGTDDERIDVVWRDLDDEIGSLAA